MNRSRSLSALAVVVAALTIAACASGGGGEGAIDDDERAQLHDAGLTETEIDCVFENTEMSAGDLIAFNELDDDADVLLSDDDLEALFSCLDDDGGSDDSADPADDGAVGPDDAGAGDERERLLAAGLPVAHIDCILGTTDLTLSELVDVVEQTGLEGIFDAIDEDDTDAMLACFEEPAE